ncbi:MAG TPA: TIGR01777 family oxidoreductase [Gemmatimonadaceae bacterium]|nr:TIGR01777 family oxidoreductase [Gemmatimonadaceae bacterium]
MKIAIAGANGFIGSALVAHLGAVGHRVVRLMRRGADASRGDATWDPSRGLLDPVVLDGVQAVVNLAGEPVAERWSADRKKRIKASRVEATTLIAKTIIGLPRPPRVLVNASAIGIYGDRGDELLDETSAPGTGFLAEVAQVWEASAAPAAERGIRTVFTRFGIVLGAAGGALKEMLPPFKLGAGGKLGSGKQWMSWVTLDDVVSAIDYAITSDRVSGPVNVVAPNPVTNAEFTHELGHALHRPAVATVPGFALKLAYGEMGEAVLLASQRVAPHALERAGFVFKHTVLAEALKQIPLGR